MKNFKGKKNFNIMPLCPWPAGDAVNVTENASD